MLTSTIIGQGDMRIKFGIFTFGYAYKYDYDLIVNERGRHKTVAGLNYSTRFDKGDFKITAESTYENAIDGIMLDYFVKTHIGFKLNGTVSLFIVGDIVENNDIQNWSTRTGIKFSLK